MKVVSRAVAAIPVRTSTGTWLAITELLAMPGSEARTRLESVTGIASILIAAEYTRQAPIVVLPTSGPRVRIRTAHGDDAIDALAEEMPLAVKPCEQSGWKLSLPCGVDDIEEVQSALHDVPGIDIRGLTDGVTAASNIALSGWSIDYNELEPS